MAQKKHKLMYSARKRGGSKEEMVGGHYIVTAWHSGKYSFIPVSLFS